MKTDKDIAFYAKKYIWYPFTQMQDFVRDSPIIIKEANGCILKDIDGREYIDGVSSLWTNVHGHRKREIDLAIKKQLDRVAHSTLLGLSNVPAIECAKKLVEITPDSLSKVFYSDSGSTAVEIALKMAFQYHQQRGQKNSKKRKFISMTNSYHGDTIGSVSVGGIDLFHEMYAPLLFDSIKVISPYCYRCHLNKSSLECELECLNQMEDVMKKHSHEVAGLIIEPIVQGAAGILIQPSGYIKKVRELCTKYSIMMIVDEVAVGFGKTGKMFACEHEEVEPDIMAVAKGITGGYMPLAATLTTEDTYQGFLGEYEEFKTFFHGHTYTGNPLACAAATANMNIFEKENVIENLQKKIGFFKEELEPFKFLEHVGDVRHIGMMAGIELVQNRETKERYPAKLKKGQYVVKEARNRGVIIRPLGDVIVIMPPLSITEDELKKVCDIIFESIKNVTDS